MDSEKYRERIKSVLITQKNIADGLVKVGKYIDENYSGKPLIIVGSG